MERMEGVYLRVPAGRLRDAFATAVEFAERYSERGFFDPVRLGDFCAAWEPVEGPRWIVAVMLAPEEGE